MWHIYVVIVVVVGKQEDEDIDNIVARVQKQNRSKLLSVFGVSYNIEIITTITLTNVGSRRLNIEHIGIGNTY